MWVCQGSYPLLSSSSHSACGVWAPNFFTSELNSAKGKSWMYFLDSRPTISEQGQTWRDGSLNVRHRNQTHHLLENHSLPPPCNAHDLAVTPQSGPGKQHWAMWHEGTSRLRDGSGCNLLAAPQEYEKYPGPQNVRVGRRWLWLWKRLLANDFSFLLRALCESV